MQHQSTNSNNMLMWPIAMSQNALNMNGAVESDAALLQSLSNSLAGSHQMSPSFDISSQQQQQHNDTMDNLDYLYQEQEQCDMLPLVAPLPMGSPANSDYLSDAVSRMQMGEVNVYHHHQQQQQHNDPSNLSLDIQPCISITEPTPVHPNMSSLGFVDQFIAQHSSQLDHSQPQHDDLSFTSKAVLDDLLMTQPGNPDWLSWTPGRGSSPISITSTSFDDQHTLHSSSPDAATLYYNLMLSADELLASTSQSVGYPSPSMSDYSDNSSATNAFEVLDTPMNNGNTLTVKKANRSRRVSEPPKLSNSLQEQFQLQYMLPLQQQQQQQQQQQPDISVRRSQSDGKRGRGRARSSSSASATGSGNHLCPHPGCGKAFTRPYNLTSHMRIHTADRPFACSQCGRRFARQHDRNRHEKLHWGIKPYACMRCQKPFARMDALNRHLRVENGCQQQMDKINNDNL